MVRPSTASRSAGRHACVAILFVLSTLPVLGETNKAAWFYAGGQVELGSEWRGMIGLVTRYSDALGGLSDRFVDVRAARRIAQAWQIIPGFRVNHARTGSGLSRRELQPSLALAWSTDVSGWELHVRGRGEYRDFDALTTDGWRARLRLRLIPTMAEGARWLPYVSNETFHDRGDRFVDENRLFVGVRHPITTAWRLDVFVGWRHRPNASVLENSIIGGLGLQGRF